VGADRLGVARHSSPVVQVPSQHVSSGVVHWWVVELPLVAITCGVKFTSCLWVLCHVAMRFEGLWVTVLWFTVVQWSCS
jgi:hypothetical protein